MHIIQLAYQVLDAKAAAEEWVKHHNAGPFFLSENIPLEGVYYKGKPSTLDHTSAYGWCGHLMIELVQQNCKTPSVFTDRSLGLHHCAYFSDSLDTELERLENSGYNVAMRANTASGIRFAFVEGDLEVENSSNAQLGHYLEVYEEHPHLRAFYARVREASLNWDRRDPVRTPG